MIDPVKDLKESVFELLIENNGEISLSSFWNFYRDKYHNLPKPTDFNKNKRNELLYLCHEVCSITGRGLIAKVQLSSNMNDRLQACQQKQSNSQNSRQGSTQRQPNIPAGRPSPQRQPNIPTGRPSSQRQHVPPQHAYVQHVYPSRNQVAYNQSR